MTKLVTCSVCGEAIYGVSSALTAQPVVRRFQDPRVAQVLDLSNITISKGS